MTVDSARPTRPYATPITRHFSASKLLANAVSTSSTLKAPSHPSPIRPQSPKYAYSPVRQASIAPTQNYKQSSSTGLSEEALRKLRNFLLRSPDAVARLRVEDIVGTTSQEGILQKPAVRKGRIAVSANKADWPSCHLIDCFPFDRCEIVATIVRKNILKSYSRCEGQNEAGLKKENIDVIYYDVDDESGVISCKVNPQKLYPQKKKPLARAASFSSTEGYTDSEAPRPTSDPRLWIYRYEKPPEPVQLPSQLTEPSVPILREGTVVRITGKITISAKKETIIDVISMTPVHKEERYAEWHHAVSCKKVREQLYRSRKAVRDLLELEGRMSDLYKSAIPDSQSMSFADLSRSSGSSVHGSTLANISHADSSYSLSYINSSSQSQYSNSSASESTRRVRKKLPSLTRLAEDKTVVNKQLFLLFMHHHFQSSRSAKDILPGHLGAKATSKTKTITLSTLKADKKLAWLALMCARNESMEALALADKSSFTSKASQKSSAANSIILPSSSPVRQYASAKKRKRSDTDVKQHINNDFVENRKISLFTWGIRKLYEEGTIAIEAGEEDRNATPKASAYRRCTCSIGHDKDPNAPLLSYRKCGCQSISTYPEEAYSLITIDRLIEPVTNIIRRLENSSNEHSNPFKDKDTLTERVWSALRQDGLWSHVRRDSVIDTLAVL